MRAPILLLLLALLAAAPAAGAAPAAAPPAPRLADVQAVNLGGGRYVVHLRGSGPLAFDVLPRRFPRLVAVRLHGVRLGNLHTTWRIPFGWVYPLEYPGGDVVVWFVLERSGMQVRVEQGDNAATVEVRVEPP